MMLNRDPFLGAPDGPGIIAGRGEGGAGHCWPDFAAAFSTRLSVCRCSAACDLFFDSRRASSDELEVDEGKVDDEAKDGAEVEADGVGAGGGCRAGTAWGGGCSGGTEGGCNRGTEGGCRGGTGFAGTRGGEGVARVPPLRKSSKPLKVIEFFGVKSAWSDALFENCAELEDGCRFGGDMGEVWKSAKSSSSKLDRIR